MGHHFVFIFANNDISERQIRCRIPLISNVCLFFNGDPDVLVLFELQNLRWLTQRQGLLDLVSWWRSTVTNTFNDSQNERVACAIPLKSMKLFLVDNWLKLVQGLDFISRYHRCNNKEKPFKIEAYQESVFAVNFALWEVNISQIVMVFLLVLHIFNGQILQL